MGLGQFWQQYLQPENQCLQRACCLQADTGGLKDTVPLNMDGQAGIGLLKVGVQQGDVWVIRQLWYELCCAAEDKCPQRCVSPDGVKGWRGQLEVLPKQVSFPLSVSSADASLPALQEGCA